MAARETALEVEGAVAVVEARALVAVGREAVGRAGQMMAKALEEVGTVEGASQVGEAGAVVETAQDKQAVQMAAGGAATGENLAVDS